MDSILNFLGGISKYGKYAAVAILIAEFAIDEIKKVNAGLPLDKLAFVEQNNN